MHLADDVVVEHLADLARGGNPVPRFHQRGLVLLADDVHAQLDALIADENRRAGDELANLVLALAAEGAVERVLRVAAGLAHGIPLSGFLTGQRPASHLGHIRRLRTVRNRLPHAARIGRALPYPALRNRLAEPSPDAVNRPLTIIVRP